MNLLSRYRLGTVITTKYLTEIRQIPDLDLRQQTVLHQIILNISEPTLRHLPEEGLLQGVLNFEDLQGYLLNRLGTMASSCMSWNQSVNVL